MVCASIEFLTRVSDCNRECDPIHKYDLAQVCDKVGMSLFLVVPLVLLLPGYAWILFSGLYRRFSVIERLTLSFIISVAFTSLITAGISFLASQYMIYSIVGSLGVSLILLLISFLKCRDSFRVTFRARFDRNLLPLVGTLCVYVVMLLLFGWSAPFYPTADAIDPIAHMQIVESISNGSAKVLMLHADYAIGMHFVSAVLGSMLSLGAWDAIRFLLTLTLLDIIFLTYFCARTLLGSSMVANFTVLIAGFVIPVDAIHLVKVGTFPNVLSDALVLAVVWLMFSYIREPNRALGLTLTFLAVAGSFVHSSFIIFLGVLWTVLPVLFFCSRNYWRNYLKGLLFTTTGLFLLAGILGAFVTRNFERIFSAYVVSSFSPTPILLTFQILLLNYLAFIGPLTILLIAAAIIFVLARQKKATGPIFTCIWFCFLLVGATVSTQDWRFVLLSLPPASFLLGNLIGSSSELFPRVKCSRISRMLIPLLFIALILSGSFIGLLPRVFDPSNRTRQEAIVDSMSWLKQNDNGESVASVGLSADYRYLEPLTGIRYAGDFESINLTLARSKDLGFQYVAVAIQSPQLPTFESSSIVQEKYRNSFVTIFYIS